MSNYSFSTRCWNWIIPSISNDIISTAIETLLIDFIIDFVRSFYMSPPLPQLTPHILHMTPRPLRTAPFFRLGIIPHPHLFNPFLCSQWAENLFLNEQVHLYFQINGISEVFRIYQLWLKIRNFAAFEKFRYPSPLYFRCRLSSGLLILPMLFVLTWV